jgi:hypothetical protein
MVLLLMVVLLNMVDNLLSMVVRLLSTVVLSMTPRFLNMLVRLLSTLVNLVLNMVARLLSMAHMAPNTLVIRLRASVHHLSINTMAAHHLSQLTTPQTKTMVHLHLVLLRTLLLLLMVTTGELQFRTRSLAMLQLQPLLQLQLGLLLHSTSTGRMAVLGKWSSSWSFFSLIPSDQSLPIGLTLHLEPLDSRKKVMRILMLWH